jgi:hypothetical protein
MASVLLVGPNIALGLIDGCPQALPKLLGFEDGDDFAFR